MDARSLEVFRPRWYFGVVMGAWTVWERRREGLRVPPEAEATA